jgi:hypothetical protein
VKCRRYALAVQTEMVRNASSFRHCVLLFRANIWNLEVRATAAEARRMLPVQCTVAHRTSFPAQGLAGLLSMTWTIYATLMRIAPLLVCDRFLIFKFRKFKCSHQCTRHKIARRTEQVVPYHRHLLPIVVLRRRRVARQSCCAIYRTTIRGRC